jgi:hypothetical protein
LFIAAAKHLERILARLGLDLLERAIDDALGDGLLAATASAR